MPTSREVMGEKRNVWEICAQTHYKEGKHREQWESSCESESRTSRGSGVLACPLQIRSQAQGGRAAGPGSHTQRSCRALVAQVFVPVTKAQGQVPWKGKQGGRKAF